MLKKLFYNKIVLLLLLLGLLPLVILGIVWSSVPHPVDPQIQAKRLAKEHGIEDFKNVAGFITTSSIIQVAETLLDKRGGYLGNDIAPPGIWLDNIPSWEFGALVQLRGLVQSMRSTLSRSQSQSKENEHLAEAEGHFFFDSNSWWLPATESQYRQGAKEMKAYLEGLALEQPNAHFLARADNLASWIGTVEARLGSISQRLSASVVASQTSSASTRGQNETSGGGQPTRTPWLEVDNIFYEARGQAYALLHFLLAMEQDFQSVLEDKNAVISLRQIINELEASQATLWSPVVLNGSGFGIMANHSLVMASHISRANTGLIELRILLTEG